MDILRRNGNEYVMKDRDSMPGQAVVEFRSVKKRVGIAPQDPRLDPADTTAVNSAPTREQEAVDLIAIAKRIDPRRSKKTWWFETTKRSLDLSIASLALVIFMPLMVVVAVILRISAAAPVVFTQQRVGRAGKPFTVYKFRSMVPDAEEMKHEVADLNHHGDSITFKIKDDPRMTRFGQFIRRTSVDELPQLWNVLKGDMSIVGPRPPLPAEVAWYSPFHLRRLEVRPGLTCIWQVSGRGDIPFEEQAELDVEYIDHRGLWLDMSIILKTIPAVLSARGAY